MNKKLLALLVVGAIGGQTAQMKAVPGADFLKYCVSLGWTSAPSDANLKIELYKANSDNDVFVRRADNTIGKLDVKTKTVSNLVAPISVQDNHLRINVDGTIQKVVAGDGDAAPVWQPLIAGDDALKTAVDGFLSGNNNYNYAISVKDEDKNDITVFGKYSNKGENFKNALPKDAKKLAKKQLKTLVTKKAGNETITWADKAAWSNADGTLYGVRWSRSTKLGKIGLMALALVGIYKWGHAQGYNEGIDEDNDDDTNDNNDDNA